MIKKGPFTLKWGDNVIQDVEEIDFSLEVDSEDFSTVQGNTYTIDGAFKVSAELTILSTDIASLAAILPQYFVNNGEELSTGETVNNATGALDIKAAACDEEATYNNLDIISCGSPGQVTRIVNARSRIVDIEIDDKIQKVIVGFFGEPESGEAVAQMFNQGTINVVS